MRSALTMPLFTSLFTMVTIAAPGVARAEARPSVDKSGAEHTGNEVPKDPGGVKGISPFWEAVKLGDAAYITRNYDEAEARYQEALKAEPRNAMGHYRLGEAELAKQQLEEAAASFDAALRFVGDDKALKAKILFVEADLAERAKNLDAALDKWHAYADYAAATQGVRSFPETAAGRSRRITAEEQLQKDYAAVKERITQREATIPSPPDKAK